MVSRWMAEHQISFHYSMLLAPGAIVASVEGFGRLGSRLGRERLGALVAGVGLLGLVAFLWAGAAPGGGRFQAGLFDMEDGQGGVRWSLSERSPWLVDAHAQVSAIEPGVGVAAPSRLSARLADRPFVTTDGTAAHQLETRGQVQAEIERVALLYKDWAVVGRPLVQGQGFSLVGWGGGPLAVLGRGPGRPEVFEVVKAVQGEPACGAVAGRWAGAGLSMCGVERDGRGRIVVTVRREVAGEEVQAWLEVEGLERPERLWLIEGLLRLEEVPVGAVVKLSTQGEVVGEAGEVALVRGEAPLRVEGGGVGVRWALDRP